MSLSRVLCLSSLLVYFVVPPQVLAQHSDEKSRDPQKQIVEIVRLKHVRADEVCHLTDELGLPVNCAWSRERIVLLAGTADTIASVRAIVITPMDVPDVSGANDQTHFIPVGRYPPDELLELALSLVDHDQTVRLPCTRLALRLQLGEPR